MDTLTEIKSEDIKKAIIERCGPEPDKQGIVCPHCGAHEVYSAKGQRNNIDLWFWMISAFKVDDSSKCNNCGKWFGLIK